MSDLLIKGMKMPKNCGCCPLAVGGRFTFTCMRLFGREYTYELAEQRQEDCPLVELPPHGRLIDADKLKTKIIRERDKKGLLSWQATKKYHFALDEIFDAPTILEATE